MILVIDADKSVVPVLKQRFSEFGIQSVQGVQSASAAKDVVEENGAAISLIIIGDKIEDAQPLEVCKELRSNSSLGSTYILMVVSSLENKTAIENSRHSGASSFIVKPYTGNDFLKYIMPYFASKVVMLVDDDPVIRKMVVKLMKMYHVEMIQIDDGTKASNQLNNMLPVRLVFMDIGLPGFNGIQLVTKIRGKPVWKKTPVVMLTSSTDAADVKKSLGAGANDYIAKPFNPDGFRERMSRYFTDAG